MNIVLLFLLFTCILCTPPQPHDKQICKKGDMWDCYRINAHAYVPPFNDTDCNEQGKSNAQILAYNTWEINEGITVLMVYATAVTSLKGRNETFDDYCNTAEARSKYNVTLRIRRDAMPNGTRFDYSIENVLTIPGLEDVTDIFTILKEISNFNFAKRFNVPPFPTRYYATLEYIHPQNEMDCHAKVLLYSCWMRNMLFGILGVAFIIPIVFACLVYCPLLICCFYCCLQSSREKNMSET